MNGPSHISSNCHYVCESLKVSCIEFNFSNVEIVFVEVDRWIRGARTALGRPAPASAPAWEEEEREENSARSGQGRRRDQTKGSADRLRVPLRAGRLRFRPRPDGSTPP